MGASEPSAVTPARIARFWPVVSGGVALLLVAALGAVIFYRQNNEPFSFEAEWMEEMVEHRSPFWTVPALIFNTVGGTWFSIFVVPVLIIALLLLWRRPWSALYFGIAALASAVVVQLFKNAFGRPRPLDMLVSPDFGSFPSGHSANAALIATALGIILARTWVWVAGALYTVAMMISRTYLGAHWISDTIGGVLVGAGVAVILWAPFARRLEEERDAGAGPVWRRA